MANYHLRDHNLSNKARGLLSTMLSLPDEWDYTTRGLARICKDGVDGITAQLKELEQCGYLIRHRIRDSGGRITDMEYIIYEKPHPPSPDTEIPYMVKPDMDSPSLEKPAQINIDKTNTDESITELSNTHSLLSDVRYVLLGFQRKHLWHFFLLQLVFFKPWLLLSVPVSAFGVSLTYWKDMAMTTRAQRARA